MSYAIHVNSFWNEDDSIINESLQSVLSSYDILSKTQEFVEWKENRGECMNEYDSDSDIIDGFMESSYRESLENSYEPSYNFIHILQNDAREVDIKLVNMLVPSCMIFRFDNLFTDAIVLATGGMDCSDGIELSYYIVDGVSPLRASDMSGLPDISKYVLKECRDISNNNLRVTTSDIMNMTKEYKNESR